MKKLLVAIIAFLYLGSSCGATVYMHYCMGKLVSIGLLQEKSTQCGRCGMDKDGKGHGCCKDEHRLVKLDKDQKATDRLDWSGQNKAFSLLHFAYADGASVRISAPAGSNALPHAPPRSREVPVYLLHLRLLI